MMAEDLHYQFIFWKSYLRTTRLLWQLFCGVIGCNSSSLILEQVLLASRFCPQILVLRWPCAVTNGMSNTPDDSNNKKHLMAVTVAWQTLDCLLS